MAREGTPPPSCRTPSWAAAAARAALSVTSRGPSLSATSRAPSDVRRRRSEYEYGSTDQPSLSPAPRSGLRSSRRRRLRVVVLNMSTAQQITAQKPSPKKAATSGSYADLPHRHTPIYTLGLLVVSGHKRPRRRRHAPRGGGGAAAVGHSEVDVAGDGGVMLEDAVGRVRRRAEGLDLCASPRGAPSSTRGARCARVSGGRSWRRG